MAAAPILQGGRSTSADGDTISSALGVGEHLSIRIDTMRMREQEEAAPGVAVGRSAVTDAPAIQVTIRHLGPAVDVGPSALAPGRPGGRRQPQPSPLGSPEQPRQRHRLVAVMRNFRTQARTYPKMNCIMKTLIPK
uniref:Uncharacterized protein n=1 Tax=Oryza meridionalis TaxID=40149 RepID=A0A0E0CK49_9ORYZ